MRMSKKKYMEEIKMLCSKLVLYDMSSQVEEMDLLRKRVEHDSALTKKSKHDLMEFVGWMEIIFGARKDVLLEGVDRITLIRVPDRIMFTRGEKKEDIDLDKWIDPGFDIDWRGVKEEFFFRKTDIESWSKFAESLPKSKNGIIFYSCVDPRAYAGSILLSQLLGYETVGSEVFFGKNDSIEQQMSVIKNNIKKGTSVVIISHNGRQDAFLNTYFYNDILSGKTLLNWFKSFVHATSSRLWYGSILSADVTGKYPVITRFDPISS